MIFRKSACFFTVEKIPSSFLTRAAPLRRPSKRGGEQAYVKKQIQEKGSKISFLTCKKLYYILWENVCILERKNVDFKASGMRSQVYKDM